MKTIAIVWFGILINHFVVAQEYSFEKITINQGLSQNSVYCILKDSKGFMWFGTEDGLNKFDGYTFTVYNTERNNKLSINSNYAYALYEISPGIFLIGTEKGFSLFESEYECFTNIKFKGLGDVSVSRILQDFDGNIWIGTYGKGLFLFKKNKDQFLSLMQGLFDKQLFQNEIVYDLVCENNGTTWVATSNGLIKLSEKAHIPEYEYIQDLNNKKILSLFFDRKHILWIGTDDGMYLYSTHEGSIKHIAFANGGKTGGLNIVKSICSDKNNKIWVGTDDGLVIVSPENGRYIVCTNSIYNPEGLSQSIIQVIYIDDEGIVWIGTDAGGINIFNEKSRKFKTIKPISSRNDWLSHKIVYGFTEDDKGKIYCATYGGGLNIFDPSLMTFQVINAVPGKINALQSNYMYSLATDHDGLIWIGTRDAGLQSYNPATGKFSNYKNEPSNFNSLSHNAVKSIFIDHDNRVWIGTYGGGLNLLDPKTGRIRRFSDFDPSNNKTKDNIVYSIFEDKQGDFWVGTRGGGLKKWDGKYGKFIRFVNNPNDSTSISNNFAFPMLEDSKGRFWVGTLGGGLQLMDRNKSEFQSITTEDGLSNNVIYSIIEDNKGILWMSTAKGLTAYNPDTKESKRYYESDGLQSSEFNGGAGYKAKNGYIYFGGINGFSYFHPDSIFINHTVPNVYITSLSILNQEMSPLNGSVLKQTIQDTKELRLDYYDNILTFKFTALNFTHSDLNQYACKMEGFENTWNQLGNRRIVNYTNLDPGVYTFRVIASNNDGIWNEKGVDLQITIDPPFYKTLWFKFCSFLFLFAAVIFYIKRLEYTLKTEKDNLEIAVKERTKEIEMQKEEIETQRDEIQTQAVNLQEANRIIDLKNRNITDSIHYASYIQNAVLPSAAVLRNILPDNFILFQPRDIVSGDFFWIKNTEETFILALADCTGHGVPGALMSMMGISLLNEIVNFQNIITPSEILEELRKKIKFAFEQSGNPAEMKDGIEIGLFVYNKAGKEITYSGANIPLLIVRKGVLVEFEPDDQPAGISLNEQPFTTCYIEPDPSDVYYLFSDGYASQFGGDKGKQFRQKRLNEILLDNHQKPFDEQKKILEREVAEWKGNWDQIDDILIVGFKL